MWCHLTPETLLLNFHRITCRYIIYMMYVVYRISSLPDVIAFVSCLSVSVKSENAS